LNKANLWILFWISVAFWIVSITVPCWYFLNYPVKEVCPHSETGKPKIPIMCEFPDTSTLDDIVALWQILGWFIWILPLEIFHKLRKIPT